MRQLEDVGVKVKIPTGHKSTRANSIDDCVDVDVDGHTIRFAVEYRKRAPYPAELQNMSDLRERLEAFGRPLIVVPFASESTGNHLASAGWSWADEAGNFDLRAPGIRLSRRTTESEPLPSRLTLPKGRGGWAVIRWLISRGEVDSLTKLALESGVSQPRVSQILNRLRDLNLVEQPSRSLWKARRDVLLDQFLREYPGPGGSASYFYSLDPLTGDVRRLLKARPTASLAVSGDVAADALVPWRRPTHLVLYSEAPLDLGRLLGLTRAHALGDANVIHRVPSDDSIFAMASKADWADVKIPLADPAQILWDLRMLSGDDRLEVSERLRTWLLRPSAT